MDLGPARTRSKESSSWDTGFIGAFAFYAPAYDGVLVGTHNASESRLLAAEGGDLAVFEQDVVNR
jgi:hypothetical protein